MSTHHNANETHLIVQMVKILVTSVLDSLWRFEITSKNSLKTKCFSPDLNLISILVATFYKA